MSKEGFKTIHFHSYSFEIWKDYSHEMICNALTFVFFHGSHITKVRHVSGNRYETIRSGG